MNFNRGNSFADRRHSGPGGGVPDDEFMFRHGLTQDVAYNSLLVSQRKALHKRAGEALELAFPTLLDELAAALASHFEKADVHDKALRYLTRAGHRARQAFANRDAIGYYTRALRLAEANSVEAARTMELHEGLGDVYALLAQYALAAEHYTIAAAGRRDPLERAIVHRKMGQLNANRALYSEAMASFTRALADLRESFDPVETGRVQTGLGMVYYRLGRLADAVEVSTLALEIMEGCQEKWGIADACNNLGIIYGRSGEMDKALQYHVRCISIWEDLGNTSGLAASHNNLARLYHQQKDWEKAIGHYQMSLELCERTGNRHGLARTYDNLAHVYISQGQAEHAWKYQNEAVRIMSQIAAEGSGLNPDLWQQSGEW